MQRARGDVTQEWKPQQTRDNYATISEVCFLCVVRAEYYKRHGLSRAVSSVGGRRQPREVRS
jgi:hypothetical protein